MKVQLHKDVLLIETRRGSIDVGKVRSLPERTFDPRSGRWKAPYTQENWDALRLMGAPIEHIDRPDVSSYRVERHKNAWLLFTPPTKENITNCRRIPDGRTWNGTRSAWTVNSTLKNLRHLEACWPHASWDEDALELKYLVLAKSDQAESLRQDKEKLAKQQELQVTDYKFGGRYPEPWHHQKEAFLLSRDEEAFALLMEQGTGKTRVIVDTACYLFAKGEIEAVLVICPNSVKDTWKEELHDHSPEWARHDLRVYDSGLKKSEKQELESFIKSNGRMRLKWLVVNVEGLSTGKLPELAAEWVARWNCLVVVDESTRIKSPSAKRTKRVFKLGKQAPYRRILTGTPVTQGPLDLYSQFRFLDRHILGFGSYYAFRNHYAIMGGYNGKQVIGYANLDELQRLIEPYSYRKLKTECLDLPPKVYEKRVVELSAQQRKAYDEMKNDMVTSLAGKEVSVTIVLTQMLRLQQIVGGFLPVPPEDETEDWVTVPIDGPNPKLQALIEETSDLPGKAIVWARFRAEIEIISNALREAYGKDSVVEFHGGVKQTDRQDARRSFQDPDSPVRFFVGQVEAGGIGLNLQAATTVIYFSNSFSLETRLQSEDRAHRGGQTNRVTYIDLLAKNTLDRRLLTVLRGKKNLADLITGDNVGQWI